MTTFVVLSGLMVIAALFFVAGPLFLRRGGIVNRDEVDAITATREQQLAELERELEDGEIDNRTYEVSRRDIESEASDRQARVEAGVATREGRPVSALVFSVLIPAGAVALYLAVGTPDAIDRPDASDMADMDVAEAADALETRLESSPDNLQGWVMLGRTRFAMGEYDKAEEAYRRALELTDDEDPRILANYAEAMSLNRPDEMVSRAGPLFRRVLAEAPEHPKGLWYSGLIAFEEGRFEDAIGHWQSLLAQDPPQAFRNVVEDRVAAAREAQGDAPATESAGEAEGEAGAFVLLDVTIDEAVAGRVESDDTVFVIARAVDGGGAPLAGVRLTASELPTRVRLGDDDAMLEGRRISDYERIEIVARVSKSGEAMPQAGDIEGSRTIEVDDFDEDAAAITIDRVVENPGND